MRLRWVHHGAGHPALHIQHTVSASSAQARYLAGLIAEIPEARIQPYLRVAKGDTQRALAYYYYNVELCRAFYPALHALEVALRNALDKAIQRYLSEHSILAARVPNPLLRSWLTMDPTLVVHTGAQASVRRAVGELLPKGADSPKKVHGDLVAALSFGFWTSLLAEAYDSDAVPPVDLAWWPAMKNVAFPSATEVTMPMISRQFVSIRHFRNRVFHHEPIWPKNAHQPTPSERYGEIVQSLRWIGGSQAELPPTLHGRPPELEMDPALTAMEGRLISSVDTLLERAARKSMEREARKAKRNGTASEGAPGDSTNGDANTTRVDVTED